MPVKEIVQKNSGILRKKAKNVTREEIKSERIQLIIADMKDTLATTNDGVAIAAPQIGQSLRIFVVSKKLLDFDIDLKNLVYINPVIIKKSRRKIEMQEGCLSVRNIFGLIKRHEKVVIKAIDENGKEFERGATGLLAEIFQHETEHLDGILFIDKAKNLKDITKNN